jgi:tetraacyldisaccharide 4'-kinase
VILTLASKLYGAAASWRRRWYGDPRRSRRLSQPVVSVGNLRAGGSGKTPTVAQVARLLMARGERPAILTRGYARPARTPGVTVVSDRSEILATFDTAGDEPLMLARALPGVPVLVGADRCLSGRLAEERFNATVHLLDDGFQHVELSRNVDLLMVSEDDLTDRVFPAGRLREGLAAARAADAVLVTAGYESAAVRVGRALGVSTAFMVSRTIGPPYMIASHDSVVVPSGERVFAIAGIARPERFFVDIANAGWVVAGSLTFRDHHRFTQRDLTRIAGQAISARAAIVLTTEKDAVRLAACDLTGVPIAAVPLTVTIDPPDAFASWLFTRLSRARSTLHQER